MTNITSINAETFAVNDIPKQRGQYEIVLDGELIGLRMLGRDGYVEGCEIQPVTNYNSSAYSDVASFIDYLKGVIFI